MIPTHMIKKSFFIISDIKFFLLWFLRKIYVMIFEEYKYVIFWNIY